MTTKKRTILIVVGAVVLLAIIVIVNLSSSSGTIQAVQADKVKKGEIISEVTATGSVRARTTVKVSADVSAKITDLPVEEGDLVKKGDVLVRLDQTRYAAAVGQAEASLASAKAAEKRAEASLLEAEQMHRRNKEMFDGKLISEETYIQVQTSYEVAKANLESAQYNTKQQKAVLEEVRDNFAKTTITSPIDGTVVSLNAEVGEIVMIGTMNNAGTVIMTIADLNTIEVEVEVDETDVARVQVGQESKISVDAFPDSTFKGEVVEVGNAAQTSGMSTDQVTNFLVKILLTDVVPGIKPGMTATADITTAKQKDVLYVPIQAVVMRPEKVDTLDKAPEKEPESGVIAAEVTKDGVTSTGQDEPKEIEGVFKIVDGAAKFVRVKTGISDQQNVEIKEGLALDEQIISGSYKILRTLEDGAKVKIEAAGKAGEK
ncbi:MAG: efflux RND transporter periplasmic adaptor subunit, partial [Candidatus Zixiibacteriota bacterium]